MLGWILFEQGAVFVEIGTMNAAPELSAQSSPQRLTRRINGKIVLVIVAIAGAALLMGLILNQDARRQSAFQRLDELGFEWSLGSSSTGGPAISLRAAAARINDGALSAAAEQLAILTRRHDLLLSPGNSIESIELAGTDVTNEGVTGLRSQFPDTIVTQ
jgi:hypothetical protein